MIQQFPSKLFFPAEIKTYIHKYLHGRVYCGFIQNTKNFKQSKCLPTGEGINKSRCIYTTEYNSEVERNYWCTHMGKY